MADSTLVLGGMTLTMTVGGVNIAPRHGGDVVRLQAADLQDIVDWLGDHGYKKRWWLE